MSLALILAISGLALVDSLNPFTIAATAYLLSTPAPLPRTAVFVAGTLATYFLWGLLLLEGWLAAFAYLLPLFPIWLVGVLEAFAGLTLLVFGLLAWRKAAQDTALKPPVNPGYLAILAFAVVVTASDIPTAVPYFAAVNRIALATESLALQLTLLGGYNVLYVSPLLAMMILRTALSPQARERTFATLRRWIDVGFAKLLPPVTALIGVLLLADGAFRVAGG